jgi:hypothetical protein
VAIRRRAISPNAVLETETYGPIPYVTDQAFLEAVLAGAQTVALGGGVLSVVVDRHPTDLDSESVTVRAVVEWRSQTRTNPSREPVAEPHRASVVETLEEEGEVLPAVSDDQMELDAPLVEEDGLDRSTLEEEDLSSIPAEMR